MSEFLYSLPLATKSAEAGIVEGYASTFGGEPDLKGDIILPGAFANSLAQHKANGTRPAMFWAHDQREPIGVPEVHEDSIGLYVKGKLSLTVQRARDAFELAKDGALAFSIGFNAIRQTKQNGVNVISEAYLGEISLVALAANPHAKITSIKSLSEVSTIREYELFLRDFGLSSRDAKRLAMSGWKAFRPDDMTALADTIRNSAQLFRGMTK